MFNIYIFAQSKGRGQKAGSIFLHGLKLVSNELLVLFSFLLLAPEEALFSNRNIRQFVSIYIFSFILLFTTSSPCRKDQFAVSHFSKSLIVQLGDAAPLIGLFVAVDLLIFSM